MIETVINVVRQRHSVDHTVILRKTFFGNTWPNQHEKSERCNLQRFFDFEPLTKTIAIASIGRKSSLNAPPPANTFTYVCSMHH